MTNNPWDVPGVPWKTEAAFLAWVRGVLRKGWSRHPVKLEFIKHNMEKIPNPNPDGRNKEVQGMTCAACKGKFPLNVPKKTINSIYKKHGVRVVCIEIDHKTQAGSLKTADDIGQFAKRLFYVTFDDLQPLCKPCHDEVTLSQKLGISIESAKIEKAIIAAAKDSKAWLIARGVEPASNATKRKQQIREILENEKES